jgi:hypothetical protein
MVPPWITLSARYWRQRKYSGSSELFRQAHAAGGLTGVGCFGPTDDNSAFGVDYFGLIDRRA